MKRIVVTAFGGTDIMALQEVPVPEPTANQVLVRVVAAGVNFADIMQRLGLYPNGPKPPFGAGFEVSGVIERVGAAVDGWRPGDAVVCFCESGYSEYVVAEPAHLLAKPPQLDFLQAAAIPCQYFTAYHALCTLGQVGPGQAVLIHAAAGGLGTMMVQVARNRGANVIGTCGTDEKCALIAALGCTFPINYRQDDFELQVRDITGGEGVRLAVDSIGGAVFDKTLRCLQPRGMLITLGVAGMQPAMVNALDLLAHNWTVAGFHLFAYTQDAIAMMGAVQQLGEWLDAGELDVIVRHVFPLEEAARVHELVAGRATVGKVVLVTGYQP